MDLVLVVSLADASCRMISMGVCLAHGELEQLLLDKRLEAQKEWLLDLLRILLDQREGSSHVHAKCNSQNNKVVSFFVLSSSLSASTAKMET